MKTINQNNTAASGSQNCAAHGNRIILEKGDSSSSEKNEAVFSSIVDIIEKSKDVSASDKAEYIKSVQNILAKNKVNIMLAGATGAGKSSTINALFNIDKAEVGYGTNPQTREIEKYTFSNVTLWDTPGFGDSPEHDRHTAGMIKDLLWRKNDEGNPLIDLVLVVVDGSSRDMMSTFELITNVIEPNVHYRDSIVVGINQTDIAMKGRHWDSENRKPESQLIEFMNDKIRSVKTRISSSCDLNVKVMYYSATERYNILKLLCFILENLPDEEKMINIAEMVNPDKTVWASHDEDTEEIYAGIEDRLQNRVGKVVSGAIAGARIGRSVAKAVGVPSLVGTVVGGFVGGLAGLFF